MEILNHIPKNLDSRKISEKLQVKKTGNWEQFQSIFEIAKASIAPKAAYAIQYINEKLENEVIINGVCFKSRVLRKNLDGVGRVFPYVVTIGADLEEKSRGLKNLLDKYYLDAIGNIALVDTRKYLEDQLLSEFALERLSFMSPGSLEDWPLEQQKPLFSFLDGVEHSIGVKLTENCIMVPRKSVSGIYFPTEITFYNCQLCPRSRCVGRKAAYSDELAGKYGIEKNEGRF